MHTPSETNMTYISTSYYLSAWEKNGKKKILASALFISLFDKFHIMLTKVDSVINVYLLMLLKCLMCIDALNSDFSSLKKIRSTDINKGYIWKEKKKSI